MFTVNTMAVRARSRPVARKAKMGARGIVEAVDWKGAWDYSTETSIVGASTQQGGVLVTGSGETVRQYGGLARGHRSTFLPVFLCSHRV
jgi:hypothetical protein